MNSAERRTAEGILFTDQHQLTMAQLYFRDGIHEQPAQFDHFFRNYPDYGMHQAGKCVLASVMDDLREGFAVNLIVPATRAVNAADGEAAVARMQEAGAGIIG